ncbi:MAG TPA: T9SS type A sorting domain-containing protein [Bacteroidetes bacterium]|nr:T9SS type A sorting domain-containing protein [Bacteroidota bacterium]
MMPPETMQLRDELLDASPFLSDTVMASAAAKEDVLPNSIITEVLTANPQSAKADNVLNTLNARTNPPNDNEMAAIHANDTVFGHKELLESKRDYFEAKKANEVYRLIRMYQADTVIAAKYDSIETALANIHTPESYYQQAFCRFYQGDSAEVLNLLNNIPSEFDLNTAQTDYNNYFSDYFNLLLTLRSQNKPFTKIDSTQKTTLYNIMDNTGGLLHAYARNLLIKTDNLLYHEHYLEIDTATMKMTKIYKPVNDNRWKADSYFKLYPNPANGYLTFEYEVDYNSARVVVEIVNLGGIHMETFRLHSNRGVKIVDLRQWKSGTYLVRLIVNGKTLQNEKFVKF